MGKGRASVISLTPGSSNGVHTNWNIVVTGLVAVEAPQEVASWLYLLVMCVMLLELKFTTVVELVRWQQVRQLVMSSALVDLSLQNYHSQAQTMASCTATLLSNICVPTHVHATDPCACTQMQSSQAN